MPFLVDGSVGLSAFYLRDAILEGRVAQPSVLLSSKGMDMILLIYLFSDAQSPACQEVPSLLSLMLEYYNDRGRLNQ